MRDLVVSVAAGKVEDTVILDLYQEEDNFGQADLPVAMMPNSEQITLIQMDGHLTKKEFDKALDLCKKASKELYKVQKEALINKYNGGNKK